MRQFCAVHLFCLLSLGIVASPLLLTTEADARTKRRKKTKTVKPAPAKPAPKTTKVSGNRVAILKFDTFKTSKDVMSYFYTALQQQLKAKPGNKIMPSNNVTINELILTAGCVSADKACLSNLGGLIQADQIVFGSVQHSDNVHLFTIKIFDFKKKDFVRVIEDQTVEGDLKKLKKAIPAVIDTAIYGNVGKLKIKIVGAQNPTVYFNGEVRAKGPTELEGLPLGEHVIKVRTANGGEKTKTVLLRQGKQPVLSFEFNELVAPTPVQDDGGSGLIVPGWITLGVGAVALGFGAYNLVTLNGLEDDAKTQFDGRPLPSTDPEASQRRQDINQRQQDMDAAYTRANIGLGVGVAGVVIGTGLLIYGYMGGSESQATASKKQSQQNVSLGVAPTRGGAAMSFGLTF